MRENFSLHGEWMAAACGQKKTVLVPGSLDTNGIGHPDVKPERVHPDNEMPDLFDDVPEIMTRLTRKVTYEGPASWTKTIRIPDTKDRVFLYVERSRVLSAFVDGEQIKDALPASISTPHVFELTGLGAGEHVLTLISDNSYPGLPRDAIVYSSAATDETQTNWNGLLGRVDLLLRPGTFLERVRVLPRGDKADICVLINADQAFLGEIRITSEAFINPVVSAVDVCAGQTEMVLSADINPKAGRWDENEGIMHDVTTSLYTGNGETMDTETESFGIRVFSSDDAGRLTCNGRRIFVRSEANCAVFPETGFPPMEENAWEKILETYRSYGINFVRFHSHVPPEAAFTVADRMGMFMEPELSHWDPHHAFEAEESFSYYRTELEQVVLWLANHPSFVMMAYGNELAAGEKGHERMRELLALAHRTDDTRMYSEASNVHYGAVGAEPTADFYTSFKWKGLDLRATYNGEMDRTGITGYINKEYPDTAHDYEASMSVIREEFAGPVFSFEVGQFEVLPDFDEIADFKGVTLPGNFEAIRRKTEEKGFAADWKKMTEATGELSRLCYREEVEAALRTPSMSGISLLGVQDFPGQGTALVGMLNSHLSPKPFAFARPEHFRSFFVGTGLLIRMPAHTYTSGEEIPFEILGVSDRAETVEGTLSYCLIKEQDTARSYGESQKEVQARLAGHEKVAAGEAVTVGEVSIPAGALSVLYKGTVTARTDEAARFDFYAEAAGLSTTVSVWIYPSIDEMLNPEIYVTDQVDEKTRRVLRDGGRVYLCLDAKLLVHGVMTQFSSDFWSVGTFPGQEGCMGQLIKTKHPLFKQFPTEFHTNWQWWEMASAGALELPYRIPAIVEEMDSYAKLRPMAQLFECRVGNGTVLVNTMGSANRSDRPEVRAFRQALVHYLNQPLADRDALAEMTVEELEELARRK